MIDQSSQLNLFGLDQSSQTGAQASSSTFVGFKGSYTPEVHMKTPFPEPAPEPVEDAIMAFSADKRSRESPDSTLKPEGKSLKTSAVATATSREDSVKSTSAVEPALVGENDDSKIETPNARWKAEDVDQAKLMQHMHRRIPAWKMKVCTEALYADPIDLARVAEVTEIQFATVELA